MAHCSACEYDNQYGYDCVCCPIKWPDDKKSPELARQIRDLEFKTKEEILKCLEASKT